MAATATLNDGFEYASYDKNSSLPEGFEYADEPQSATISGGFEYLKMASLLSGFEYIKTQKPKFFTYLIPD